MGFDSLEWLLKRLGAPAELTHKLTKKLWALWLGLGGIALAGHSGQAQVGSGSSRRSKSSAPRYRWADQEICLKKNFDADVGREPDDLASGFFLRSVIRICDCYTDVICRFSRPCKLLKIWRGRQGSLRHRYCVPRCVPRNLDGRCPIAGRRTLQRRQWQGLAGIKALDTCFLLLLP